MLGDDARRLADLVDEPREALDVEVKEWLDLSHRAHQATLAKEIIALANHGGGFVVIGFRETEEGQFEPASDRPDDLTRWSQDAIQGIVSRYVDPPVQCTVTHQLDAATELLFPVISVPGGHRVPIVAKRGSPIEGDLIARRVLVRRPGPNSEEPQSPEEWHQLFDRIVKNRQADLLDLFRSILSGDLPTTTPSPEPSREQELDAFVEHAVSRWTNRVSHTPIDTGPRLPHGHYDASFAVDDEFEAKTLTETKEAIEQAVRNHSGWPPFVTINRHPFSPKSVDGAIESWLGEVDDGSFQDPEHSDFWRVSPNGFLFTRRGYSEDGSRSREVPGTSFDITTATWRLGEAILNASYIASALGAGDADLICRASWSGLSERRLVSYGNQRRSISDRYRSAQDEYVVQKRVALSSVSSLLPELVHEMLAPLYELFDFFILPKSLVEQELAELQRNRY